MTSAPRTPVSSLEAVFDDAPIGFAIFDSALRFIRINACLAEMNGMSVEAHLGRAIYDVLPSPDVDEVMRRLRHVLETGEPLRGVEILAPGPDARGVVRRFHCDYRPVPLEGGERGVSAAVVETTDAVATAERLVDSEARMRHVLDATLAYVAVLNADGVVQTVNAPALSQSGLLPADVLNRPLADTYWWTHAPEAQDDMREVIARAGRGEACRRAMKMRTGPNRMGDFLFQVTPVRSFSGAVQRIVVSAIDVSELVEARQRQELLAAELNHRVKNILAIVRALITQTGRRVADKAELVRALEGRIGGMARTVALLTRAEWSGHGLQDILREQLQESWGERIALEGPNLTLTPKVALSFGLIAYELMSNAAKHGALSVPGGRVLVSWFAEGGDLRWRWREAGGPAVASAPTEHGFGSLLVRSVGEGDLSAVVDFRFERDGLEVWLTAPLARLVAGAEGAARSTRVPGLRGAEIIVAEPSAIVALDLVSVLEAAGAHTPPPVTSAAELRERVSQASGRLGVVAASRLLDDALLGELLERGHAVVMIGGEQPLPDAVPRLGKPFSDADLVAALRTALHGG